MRTGSTPVDLLKPTGPKPALPKVDAPKAPAPMVTIAQQSPAAGIEEGEILIGNTLLSLKGVAGSSFTPPLDKEVDTLEESNVDEAGKLRLCGVLRYLACLRPYIFCSCIAFCSCVRVNETAFGHNAWAWHHRDPSPEKGTTERDSVLFLLNF